MGQEKPSDRERLLRLLAGDAPPHPGGNEASVVRLMEKQSEAAGADWRDGLPVLRGARVTLRELQLIGVPGLITNLTTAEVTRFLSPPPRTVEEFERFIAWIHWERADGRYACFAVVPEEFDASVGLFQLRMPEPGFATAEWGFALGSAFWGTGLFRTAAHLVLEFVFDRIGTHGWRRVSLYQTDEAMRPCGRLAPCRRASCAGRSCATASMWTRPSGRFSTKIGDARRKSRDRLFTKLLQSPAAADRSGQSPGPSLSSSVSLPGKMSSEVLRTCEQSR